MSLRKDLELIEVVYKNERKKVVLTFLDIEMGEVVEVNFNKQIYDADTFIDDKEKAKKVDEWCKEYFDKDFDHLSECIGDKKDVYLYENFNSLWESQITEKFTVDDMGKIFTTKISRIEDDGKGIHIYFEDDGKEYESKMMYSDYMENHKKWFVNPTKRNKQYQKFKNKFGVDIKEKDSIVEKEIMVEVKVAFKKHAYCEIKKPSWVK